MSSSPALTRSPTPRTQRIEILESRLVSNPLHSDPALPSLYDQYAAKESLKLKIRATKKKITQAQSVMHLDELKNRKRALRRLGFATGEDVVEQKGRVACEISSGDELLLTEMVFGGVFNDLTAQQCAALLSCFVFDEKVRRVSPLALSFWSPCYHSSANGQALTPFTPRNRARAERADVEAQGGARRPAARHARGGPKDRKDCHREQDARRRGCVALLPPWRATSGTQQD